MFRWLANLRRRPAATAVVTPTVDVAAFLAAGRVYGPVDRQSIRECGSELRAAVLASAERALEHRFDLLGSGPYQPIDPFRASAAGYRPIDWAFDPVARARFPNAQPSAGCDIAAIRPPGADIKRPWELARCYHWVTLAQAWALTEDPRFARELFLQADDFMTANPAGHGIQWVCTMDVAIRAANWLIALELIRDAPVAPETWQPALAALLTHGAFIRTHLENHYEVTSNHYLSNIVGLLLVGLSFPGRQDAGEWVSFSLAALEAEIEVQVLPDGMDFESSIPYHRLVTELFFAGWRAAAVAGRPLSLNYRRRLMQMHDFMGAVLRPDGLMPQHGDADDGRLHVFRGHDLQRPQDPRHLFGPAAAAFDVAAWVPLGGSEAAWDAAWWGLSLESRPFAAEPRDAFFPDAGIAVHREADGTYLLVTNAAVGTRGFGNHKHNDLLSFEYHLSGCPLIVDPGSFVYTSDPDARNLMRSVVSHNTLAPPGREPNEFKPEWLFRMFERATPEHLEYEADGRVFRYRGRHRGYADAGLLVERSVQLEGGRLEVTDVVEHEHEGEVPLAWRFHVVPDVTVAVHPDTGAVLRSGSLSVRLATPAGLSVTTAPAWYSPSYGVRLATTQIVCHGTCRGRGRHSWTFVLARATPDPR